MTRVAHKLFVQTAREMAAATYESMAQNNEFYAACKAGDLSQDVFVEKVYSNFLPEAKKTLTSMLSLPSTPEWMKEQIYEALLEDNLAQNTVNRHERRAARSASKIRNGQFV
jgi:hypothetical protein